MINNIFIKTKKSIKYDFKLKFIIKLLLNLKNCFELLKIC